LISDALAEFSALILSERKYRKENIKRFLKDELDDYLSDRSNEGKRKMYLSTVTAPINGTIREV
jgi:ABC-2 type transport system permease protein